MHPKNWRPIETDEIVQFLQVEGTNPKRTAFNTVQRLEGFYGLPLLESTTAAQAWYGRVVRAGFLLALSAFLDIEVSELDLDRNGVFYTNLDSTSWIAHDNEEVDSEWLCMTKHYGQEFFVISDSYGLRGGVKDASVSQVRINEIPLKSRKVTKRRTVKEIKKEKEKELIQALNASPLWVQENFLVAEKIQEFFQLPKFKSGSVKQIIFATSLRAAFLVDLVLKSGRTFKTLALPVSSAFYTKLASKDWCEQAKHAVDTEWLGLAGRYQKEGEDLWVSANTDLLDADTFSDLFEEKNKKSLRLVKG